MARIWRCLPSLAQRSCLTSGGVHNTATLTTSAAGSKLDHLCSLSDRLYLETPNSSAYRILRPPQAFRELLPEQPDQTELINDWNEVLWTMDGMRVTPEMADQLSGAIYMHALMQVRLLKCG